MLGLVALSLSFFLTADWVSAQSFGDVLKDGRDYKLESIDAAAPDRVVDFRFYEKPTYTRLPAIMICGDCLCVTAVLTDTYPKLGIKPTSGSPTFACGFGSDEMEQDGGIAEKFLAMSHLEATGDVITFSGERGNTMVFRMRSDMESCLNWFEDEGQLAVRNSCTEPTQVQIFVPQTAESFALTIPASSILQSGRGNEETQGFIYAACPVGMQLDVPFDETGFDRIRNRDYECR